MVTFNRRRKDDGKGTGKIRLGDFSESNNDAETSTNENASSSNKSPKKGFLQTTWGKVAVAGGAAIVIGLSVMMFTGGSNDVPHTPTPTHTVDNTQTPTPPVVTQNDVQRDAVRDKLASVYQDRQNTLAEAFMDAAGREVARGQDFAVHVGLYNRGGISVLITEGEHAGTRVGFFPVSQNGRPELFVEKVGQQAVGSDGTTMRYERLASADRETYRDDLRRPRTEGSGISVNEGIWFEDVVRQGGQTATAFMVSGAPSENGSFSITIWNGDRYSIDLNTGEYSISSAFVTDPDYQSVYERTGQSVERTERNGRVPSF